MKRIRKILVPTDLSQHSRRARITASFLMHPQIDLGASSP